MGLPAQVQEKIVFWLPKLDHQPICPTLDTHISLQDAEKELNLQVIGFLDNTNIRWIRLIVNIGKHGPYYFEVWAFQGKPYIRLLDERQGVNVDIVLL